MSKEVVNTIEKSEEITNKFRRVKIPKQDFEHDQNATRQLIDDSLVDNLKEVFILFSENNLVNPHNLKNGLRSINFHKANPEIYKLIENLCLDFDINEKLLTFEQFISYLNSQLGDCSTRQGTSKLFNKLMDEKIEEITPESLHKILTECGDSLSLEDVRYMMSKISSIETDINITSEEFYYMMTKKPAEIDNIKLVTKSLK